MEEERTNETPIEEKMLGEKMWGPEGAHNETEPDAARESEKESEKADETGATETDESGEANETESLKAQLAAARADLYNYRQRTERDRAKTRKLISEDKAAEFLPVLDNLDRALGVPESGTAKDVLVGVRMVQRQFLSVLENSGVTVIPTEGCPFDPLQHEAIETEFVEDPGRNGMILGELLRGYRTSDRVLRPAQVRVGKLRE
ncbi:MAG: nucleotide exchange factor GrpE [Synergistaceae bacterium]|nr:nucleotide exchange factor GrpE [Synergistaceae bacterium]